MLKYKSSFRTHTVDDEHGKFKITPSDTLSSLGAILPVVISINQSLTDYLNAFNQTLPTPTTTTALIDTGAKTSCIDIKLARKMLAHKI